LDEAVIRDSLRNNGSDCGGSLREKPCQLLNPVSSETLSFLMRAEDLLLVSRGAAAEPGRGANDDPELRKLIVEARTALDDGSVLWATFQPGHLRETLSQYEGGLANLQFLARALEKADRGYLSARDQEGGVQVTLKAACAGEAMATSMAGLVIGLNRLAAAALETGQAEEPLPAVRALRQARIASTGPNVVGIWTFDDAALEAWK
jgi:hypothetical protein